MSQHHNVDALPWVKAFEDLLEAHNHLGAHRVFQGNAWWWDLKLDFKPADVVTL